MSSGGIRAITCNNIMGPEGDSREALEFLVVRMQTPEHLTIFGLHKGRAKGTKESCRLSSSSLSWEVRSQLSNRVCYCHLMNTGENAKRPTQDNHKGLSHPMYQPCQGGEILI
jgi:hypothetical protein